MKTYAICGRGQNPENSIARALYFERDSALNWFHSFHGTITKSVGLWEFNGYNWELLDVLFPIGM